MSRSEQNLPDYKNRIDALVEVGKGWSDEWPNLEGPTKQTAAKAIALIKKGCYPTDIVQSIEEGILLTFRRLKSRCFLEILNDGEIGYHHHDPCLDEIGVGCVDSIQDAFDLLADLGYAKLIS